jgi:hypothetical protein
VVERPSVRAPYCKGTHHWPTRLIYERQIYVNVRKISNIINYVNRAREKNNMIIFIDAKKVDKIQHPFLI